MVFRLRFGLDWLDWRAGGDPEIGSRLTGGNPLGAVAGGLTGGLLGGIATAAEQTAARSPARALEGVREDDLQTALQRMEAARQTGIPLNLNQAMPRDSNIDTYVDALASSRHGTKTAEMLRNQPAQVALGTEGNSLPAYQGRSVYLGAGEQRTGRNSSGD